MTAIGIDFGTTNSVVSYFEGGEAKLFAPSGGRPQIRSAISQEREGRRTLIGRAAFRRRGLSLIDRFKLAIGRSSESDLAAKAFLNELINLFRTHRDAEVSSVVITVPEIWMRNEGQISYQALLNICAELRLPLRKILSEPVAAASYFADRLVRAGRPFSGHALIYDHGGGTLDISLVHVEGTDILTLDGAGIALAKQGIGGMHFDDAIADHCAQKSAEASAVIAADRSAWLDEFEENKIELAAVIEDGVAAFLQIGRDSAFDDPLVEVKGISIKASDIIEVFETSFSGRIVECLDALLGRNADKIDYADESSFRVVAVGGFSSFFLVRRLLEEKFDRTHLPGIFETEVPVGEAPFAIAKGACLYSAQKTNVFETCPIGISVRLRNQHDCEVLTPLLVRGTPLQSVRTPVFAPAEIVPGSRAVLREGPIHFVVSSSSGERDIQTDVPAALVLPAVAEAKGWRIGAYVSDDLIAHVVVERTDGKSDAREVTLGEIMSIGEPKKDCDDVVQVWC